MKYRRQVGYFIMMLLYLNCCSCNDKATNSLSQVNVVNDTKDSLVKDIPDWYEGSPNERLDIKVRDALKLPALRNGFDSVQIRIGISCRYKPNNLIVIENSGSKWKASFYTYTFYDQEELEVDEVKAQNIEPKSGWLIFMDSLYHTEIMNLPRLQTPSPKSYDMPSDGSSVTVEIATQRLYRLYDYPSLEWNYRNHKEAGKLYAALQLIKSEFGFGPCMNELN